MCTHKHRAVSNQPRATFLFSSFFVFCRFLSCTVASRLSLVLSNNSGAPSLSTYHSHSVCLSLWGYWLPIINSFFSDSVPSHAEWAGGSRGGSRGGEKRDWKSDRRRKRRKMHATCRQRLCTSCQPDRCRVCTDKCVVLKCKHPQHKPAPWATYRTPQ